MSNIFKKISVTAAAVLALSSSAWAIELDKDNEDHESKSAKNSQPYKHHLNANMHKKDHYKEDFVNKMFANTDLDNNGKISRPEMLASASAEFDRRDLNSDGEISKEEIKEAYSNMKKQYQQENLSSEKKQYRNHKYSKLKKSNEDSDNQDLDTK